MTIFHAHGTIKISTGATAIFAKLAMIVQPGTLANLREHGVT